MFLRKLFISNVYISRGEVKPSQIDACIAFSLLNREPFLRAKYMTRATEHGTCTQCAISIYKIGL